MALKDLHLWSCQTGDPSPRIIAFKSGKDVIEMSFKGRLRPEANSRAILFSTDLPRLLPQNEPLTLEECGRWITDEEAACMTHCYEMKKLEVIGQYSDPSSVSVKIVPDRQMWLPWSIPGKRKEPAPGKIPFSRIGLKEYEEAPKKFDVKSFSKLLIKDLSEDHARRIYLTSLKKNQHSTGASGCCDAEKATIPTVGAITRVTDLNLRILHIDDMYMCPVIRPINVTRISELRAGITKLFEIGFTWSQWSESWKDKVILPRFEPIKIEADEKENMRQLFLAENEALLNTFEEMGMFIRTHLDEDSAIKYDAFTADLIKHRERVFLSLLFPEEIVKSWQVDLEVTRTLEKRKLGSLIRWFLPNNNFFQRSREKKERQLFLSNLVLEEHQKMTPLPSVAYVPEAESAPSTSSVEMVTIPKEEFETMKATCLKVPELESQLKLIMEHIKLLPPNP